MSKMTPEHEVFIKMLKFNKGKKVQTKYGPKLLRTAVVPDSFWPYYRENKDFLKEHGYQLSRDKKSEQWKINHWGDVDSDWEKKALQTMEESRASDSNIVIPVPQGCEFMPFQKAGVNFAFKRKSVLLADEMGLGKEQPVSEPVLTLDGWVKMGDLKVGNYVVGSDGKKTKIIGVYPQGNKRVFKLTFRDGASTRCGEEHLWKVRTTANFKRDGWRVKTLKQILELGVKNSHGKSKWAIPLAEPIQHEDRSFSIEPYVLGVLLGDGCTCLPSITITIGHLDMDIKTKVEESLDATMRIREKKGCVEATIKGMRPAIEKLKLNVKSKEKFIPEEYLYGSVSQRMDLLRGLMDTDGSCIKNRTTFHTCSQRMAEGVCKLVRSLGGMAIKREYDRTEEGKSVEYQVNVKTFFNPFSTARKAGAWSPARRNGLVQSIQKVEEVEPEDSICIQVEAEDRLYVTSDYILTHNTVQAIGVINMDASIKSVVIACPTSLSINWARELRKWLSRDLKIAIFTADSQDWESDIYVIPYSLIDRYPRLAEKEFDLRIVDEAHFVKNPKSKRAKATYAIKSRRKISITGTPIPNKPKEIFPILNDLDPEIWGNYFSFAKRYCKAYRDRFGWNFDGASHLEELNTKLRSTLMIRRLKNEVVNEMPDKLRQVVELPSQGMEALIEQEIQAYKSMQKSWTKYAEEMDEYGGDANSLGELQKLRKKVALAKLPMILEYIDQLIDEQGNKLIVFAYHHEIIDAIKKKYENMSVVLTGKTPLEERQRAVDLFQTNNNIKIFIGNIKAAGVGLTLTASSHVIFTEMDWVPANMVQAEDRAHRIGQKKSVFVQYFVLEGSLDARIAKVIDNKLKIEDTVLNKVIELEIEESSKLKLTSK